MGDNRTQVCSKHLTYWQEKDCPSKSTQTLGFPGHTFISMNAFTNQHFSILASPQGCRWKCWITCFDNLPSGLGPYSANGNEEDPLRYLTRITTTLLLKWPSNLERNESQFKLNIKYFTNPSCIQHYHPVYQPLKQADGLMTGQTWKSTSRQQMFKTTKRENSNPQKNSSKESRIAFLDHDILDPYRGVCKRQARLTKEYHATDQTDCDLKLIWEPSFGLFNQDPVIITKYCWVHSAEEFWNDVQTR